ncbi:serine/threonine-protein phosphatase PP1 [Brachypodium distachyon]|uniref:Serine/threonine-protein phosphatase n=1 Tax=Brachypodium distachyon TaxID=15368 RepID=I1GKJ4_BRADI|nr:serine/threonine-protein phosphatase PP1 [Brachypodium distachyon]KQK11962.1 hypothetical protein BRADI_1g00690v3 [Brachypodium distachyon]|eukprot:XP_003558253.1 serine/threonine-protein phosphatase PP1 [Brachypodium distachyon]
MERAALDDVIRRLLEVRRYRAGKQVQLAEWEIRQLCAASKDVLMRQPNLLELQAPIKIAGDIHGQYPDLLRLFELGGFPPKHKYLFLGDYVDRGKQSIETMCLLLAYKLKYPEHFFLLRGNHECASISRVYGFYDECKRRYSVRLWRLFADAVFAHLPPAALVDGRILCVHGGLSPQLLLRACDLRRDINALPRVPDVPESGLLCDLLWSDPAAAAGAGGASASSGWGENERGVSYTFGADVVERFLERHDLDLVCRAHQVVEDGYQFFAGKRMVTVFSAPNYCGEFDNAAAIMCVDDELTCSFQIIRPASARYSTSSRGIRSPWC